MIAQTYEEWAAHAQDSPEAALKMYFDACFTYMNLSTRDEGRKMLAHIMKADDNWDKRPSYQTFASRLKDANYHHILKSFAKGTSPENGYTMNPDDYELDIVSQTPESDYLRVLLKSTGADSPRITWVKQYPDGKCYVVNNAGTYSGVRPPAQ